MAVAAGPLALLAENIRGFLAIHLDPNEPGASDLISRIDTYALQYLGVADLSYFESYPPMFSAERYQVIEREENICYDTRRWHLFVCLF